MAQRFQAPVAMRRSPTRLLLLALTVAFIGIPALHAEDACPCVPLPKAWVVKTCADWNCASTELLLANGDPLVFAIPVAVGDPRWLVIRRATGGVIIENPAEPFRVEQFDGMSKGFARFGEIDRLRQPLLLSAPDGQALVVFLKEPERRRLASRR